jgi:hypothetical protein
MKNIFKSIGLIIWLVLVALAKGGDSNGNINEGMEYDGEGKLLKRRE